MDKNKFLDDVKNGVLLFDGGNGTEYYNRGIFINRCFEELNITNPSLVTQVHEDYKKAGVDILETNTFGANRFKLKSFQLFDQLYEINYQGAKLAKEVAGDDILIAGSIGPLTVQIEPLGPISRMEARQYFQEQAQPLLDGGIDIFLLETFILSAEVKEAVKALRELSDIPIIAQMTFKDDTTTLTGTKPELAIKHLEDSGADVIGANCSVGPQGMLNWLEKVRKHTALPISVMPNAGKPKSIEGRNIYLASPEYLGEYAKHYIQAGASIIGGCCGTGPEHIKRMRNTINALKPGLKRKPIEVVQFEIPQDVDVIKSENKSRLARRLHDGHFVTFVELLAPHGVSAIKQLEKAKEMNYFGIDVINIPDGPRASARMSAMSLAVQIQREVGIETVLHYVCRDRNIIGIQSDLLGAYALGLKNILAITGDPPKLGNYPDATAVFDVDSIGLVNIINRLNHGLDISGNPIGKPTAFFTGVGTNPGAFNLDQELSRLDWKIDAGAEYFVTQPVFDLKIFENFLDKTQHLKVPIIAGLWPLTSLRNAIFMNNEIPGCHVPDKIMARLQKYENSKDDSIKEGIQIAKETLDKMKHIINGLQISAPFGRVESVIEVLKDFRI